MSCSWVWRIFEGSAVGEGWAARDGGSRCNRDPSPTSPARSPRPTSLASVFVVVVSYLMVLPVRRRIHWGMGRFCFCALASFCFVRKVLWLCFAMVVSPGARVESPAARIASLPGLPWPRRVQFWVDDRKFRRKCSS